MISEWLQSPVGRRVYALERKYVGEALAHVFGWQLLQIGHWGTSEDGDGGLLAESRTQQKSVVARAEGSFVPFPAPAGGRVGRIVSRIDSLAIAADSVDAVLLPHTLEQEPDPHTVLREVERILMGDGQLIVLGFRPISLWGLRHLLARHGYPPGAERLISEWRVRDWLKLLGFEIVDAQRFLFTGPWGKAAPGSQRFFEIVGKQTWPFFAGGYLLKARKRVYSMTPIRLSWRTRTGVVGGLAEPAARRAGSGLQSTGYTSDAGENPSALPLGRGP
jgi:SAM-dependent methyltransferase